MKQKDISNIHASIRWENGEWVINDHNSKNGTFLIHQQLPKIKSVKLSLDAVIRFGSCPESCWKVIDLKPPTPALVACEDNRRIIILANYNVFPTEENPEITIISPEPGKWRLEKQDFVTPLTNDDIIEIDSVFWCCRNLAIEDSTFDNPEINTINDMLHSGILYKFEVSRNEEHVNITILHRSETIELGDRSHHYLLLTLARQKIEDSRAGLAPAEQGWISMDNISQMLDMDKEHINIQIYRARNQIKQLETAGAPIPYLMNIIERKSGIIRLGIPNIKIYAATGLESLYSNNESS